MPRGNRMGPEGRGPMTGRRMGNCAGYDVPEFSRGRGMGYKHGMGRGRGMGRCWSEAYPMSDQAGYIPVPTYVSNPVEEQRHLEECAQLLESDLEGIKKRIQELEKTEE